MKLVIDLIVLLLNLYNYVLIGSIIFSWLYVFNVINTRNQFVNMVGEFFYKTTEPILKPIRRYMPNLGGIDISPVFLFIGIWFVQSALIDYIKPLMPF